jgi:hypothetical protein
MPYTAGPVYSYTVYNYKLSYHVASAGNHAGHCIARFRNFTMKTNLKKNLYRPVIILYYYCYIIILYSIR